MEQCILLGHEQKVLGEISEEPRARLHNRLLLITYVEASQYRTAYQSTMIDLALKMNCGAIMSQGWGSTVDEEIFGIEEVDCGGFGKSGYDKYNRPNDRPLPQAMDYQVDVAILLQLKSYEKNLLKILTAKLFGKKTDRP